ncbi:MAG: dTDP-4-dehydrorhamnose 3,5-epimerase family protein [Chloroflexota bacterium]
MTATEDALIHGRYAQVESTQSYASHPAIEGVKLLDLPHFSDEGGDFCEITRLNDAGVLESFPQFKPAQMSYSFMEPGAIKAWHLHHAQSDVWFVPASDRLLVGLVDVRGDSPSLDRRMRLTMGAGNARLLLIPPGVAHGSANVSDRPASLIYLTDRRFDASNPDEHRLPWDLLGKEFWTIRPG